MPPFGFATPSAGSGEDKRLISITPILRASPTAAILTGLRLISVSDRVEGLKLRDMMKLMLRPRLLAAFGAVAFLAWAPARAQNLDEGKSGARLFADSCATCHHGARGLAKGRFRLTLYLFLQQHYASNSNSAWELASYLESVDDMPRGRPRAAPKRAPASRSPSSLRPPAPVPQR